MPIMDRVMNDVSQKKMYGIEVLYYEHEFSQ